MTKYVVLKANADGTTNVSSTNQTSWSVLKMIDAATAHAAVSAAVKGSDLKAGSFVAVPMRSWKTVTVQTEQTVKLKFS